MKSQLTFSFPLHFFIIPGCPKEMRIYSEESEYPSCCWAAKIFEDGIIDEYVKPFGNFWCGKKNKKSKFVIDLGCSVIIHGVTIRNSKTQQLLWGTKTFSIYIADESDGPWWKAMTGDFEDPRQLSTVPIKYFDMTGKGRFVKFQVEDFYGIGAAVQYFELHSKYSDVWYRASNALEPANCDHYSFNYEVEGFR